MTSPSDYKGGIYPVRSFDPLAIELNTPMSPTYQNTSYKYCMAFNENDQRLIEEDKDTKCKKAKGVFKGQCDQTNPFSIWQNYDSNAHYIRKSVSGPEYAGNYFKNESVLLRPSLGSFFRPLFERNITFMSFFALFSGILSLLASFKWSKQKMILVIAVIPTLFLITNKANLLAFNVNKFARKTCQGMDDSLYYRTRAAPECITTNTKTYTRAAWAIFLTGKDYEDYKKDCSVLNSETICRSAGACTWNPIEIPAVPENKDLNSRAQAKVPANTCVSKDYKLGRDVYKCSNEELKYWYGDGKRCGTFSDQVKGVNVILDAVKRDCGGYVDYEKANCWKKKTAPKCTWKEEDVITGCTDSTKNLPLCTDPSLYLKGEKGVISSTDYRIGLKYTLDKNSGTKSVSDTMADYEQCDDDFHKRLVDYEIYRNFTYNVPKYCISDIDGGRVDVSLATSATRARVLSAGLGFLYLQLFVSILSLIHGAYFGSMYTDMEINIWSKKESNPFASRRPSVTNPLAVLNLETQGGDWVKMVDPNTGVESWYNSRTGERSNTQPER